MSNPTKATMSARINFTDSAKMFPWYIQSKEADLVLFELDKDLKKWGGRTHLNFEDERIGTTIEAKFGERVYWFTVSIEVEEEGLQVVTQDDVPEQYKLTLKSHLKVRNAMKNFMPILFDRVVANGSLVLTEIGVGAKDHNGSSYCTWAVNIAGLCVKFTTISQATEEEDTKPPQRSAPEWIRNLMTQPLHRGS